MSVDVVDIVNVVVVKRFVSFMKNGNTYTIDIIP